ncbi:hypothetical protein CRG98_025558 [Punica granatum]|uniref:Uncharacterized protein n=1 Tax=Punica granatum TaxID=22663 RepID=A0A2I0JCT6_PUNGR|nr:hypothetical protein CRG98_025558 [Punica granatum]
MVKRTKRVREMVLQRRQEARKLEMARLMEKLDADNGQEEGRKAALGRKKRRMMISDGGLLGERELRCRRSLKRKEPRVKEREGERALVMRMMDPRVHGAEAEKMRTVDDDDAVFGAFCPERKRATERAEAAALKPEVRKMKLMEVTGLDASVKGKCSRGWEGAAGDWIYRRSVELKAAAQRKNRKERKRKRWSESRE